MEVGVASDRCFCCRQRFADVQGPPDVRRHEHHVIPRAYGGADGPTVMICVSHHDLTHAIGRRLISARPADELFPPDPELSRRLLFLASRIQAAYHFSKKDPNRPRVVSLTMDRELQRRFNLVQKATRQPSAEATLAHLVNAFYTHISPTK